MRRAGAALIAAIACMAASATAQPAAANEEAGTFDFGFAPPLDRDLRYAIERGGRRGDVATGARMSQIFRFERRAGGYRLWVELEEVDAGAGPGAALIEAAASPMVGLRYAIDLTERGEPVGIVDQDTAWSGFLEGVSAIRSGIVADAAIADELRHVSLGVLARFGSMDEAAQRAQLLQPAENLLAFAGRSVRNSPQPHEIGLPAPWGGISRLTGTLRARLSGPDMVELVVDTDGFAEESGLRIEETTRYRVAPSSGLLHEMRRERRTGPQGFPEAETQVEIHAMRLAGGWEAEAETARPPP